MNSIEKKAHPLRWIPSVYFLMGVPFGFVVLLSVIMYKKLGISNAEIAFYTGLLTLPWSFKPIWATFVEMFKTKRWWIYTTEFFIACFFFAIAFSLFSNNYFVISLGLFFLCALFASTQDISGDGFYILNLSFEQQALYIGFCGVCYNVGKIVSSGLLVIIAGYLITVTGNSKLSWAIALCVGGVIFFAGFMYNFIFLPKKEFRAIETPTTFKEAANDFARVYIEFFKIDKLWLGLLFIFLFELGESQVLKIAPLFLLDSTQNGGLALNTGFVGLAYGVIASVAIMISGFIGGIVIYRKGLKYWMWPMYLAINIPQIVYVILAYTQLTNHTVILLFIFIEQFGYGFAYTAYLLYLRYLVKDSNFKTAHYAFFTAFIMLSFTLPSMLSGWLQEMMGYKHFFIFVILLMIPAIWVIRKLGIDPDFGKMKSKKV
jgi:MFS transporter, PAT family, beta-lactamase induction signal transducer AmpG